MSKTELTDRVGEIIEASTTDFVAQCYELYRSPPLGSLVKTGDIYGIVGNAATTSLEPGRRPIARGKDEATEEAVINSLLKALTVTGFHGRTSEAIPVDRVVEVCKRYGAIQP